MTDPRDFEPYIRPATIPPAAFVVDFSRGDDEEADSMWSFGTSPIKFTCGQCAAAQDADVIANHIQPMEGGDADRPCEIHGSYFKSVRGRWVPIR